MEDEQTAGAKRRIRHHIHEITLEPDKSAYKIIIELLVDGNRSHKLPSIQQGQPLRWTDLRLPCDLSESSSIGVQVTEVHPFSPKDRVGKATYRSSEVIGPGFGSAGCDNGMFEVHVKMLDEETAKQAYLEALQKVQRLEKQSGVLEKAGRVGDAFKVFLNLGSLMADLDPTGGAKIVFSVCTAAWEHLERQEKQDEDLNMLVKQMRRTVPSVNSVQAIADDNLKETVMNMLNLIEDVSLFILNFRTGGPIGRALRAVIRSGVQEQIQTYIAEFGELRREFDTRMEAQTLQAVKNQ
ncbi:hypothetical protein FRC07_001833, partial [Ceratobasidium sp. 392]